MGNNRKSEVCYKIVIFLKEKNIKKPHLYNAVFYLIKVLLES